MVGVGNVDGRLVARRGGADRVAADARAASSGTSCRRCARRACPVERGDLVLLATDGLSAGFADDLEPRGRCAAIARRLLDDFGRPADDALVVVAPLLWEAA